MNISLTYPPLEHQQKIPLLSQNRQFQWAHKATYIYPVIMASAATLLQKSGHQIQWLDAIAENLSYDQWLGQLIKFKPNLIVFETKTPVIQLHWQIVNRLKSTFPKAKIALVGDHVTALPEESFLNSQVDYILTGGNYDFLLLNLAHHLDKNACLEAGIYYRDSKDKIQNSGKFLLNHNLNSSPFIDRQLTKWHLYAYKNGNYKNTPGTYIMAGRDCWWRKNGGCSFCSWTTLYPQYSVRTVGNVISEIKNLVNHFKVKEIMDDTGTFPNGQWLHDFCQKMITTGLNQKINFDCNLRFNNLQKADYKIMAKAGFRFLLFGLESANQSTLDKINKGIKLDKVKEELIWIKQVNQETHGHLEPHITCMVGYPWENKGQAQNTINFCKNLFKLNLIKTLQATIIIPYPGTKLFSNCQKQNMLKTQNWSDYDMSKPVMKSPLSDKQIKSLTRQIYTSVLTPSFIINQVRSIKTLNDLKKLTSSFFYWLARLLDFSK